MRANKLGFAFVVLLAALCVAGTATAKDKVKTGGTLNVDLTTDVDYTDPALSYLSTGWELEYATGLKLMNYPDGIGPRTSQLVPEAAAGFPKVSNNGKTYDFTINANFTKFSNGQPVTAAAFKAASRRGRWRASRCPSSPPSRRTRRTTRTASSLRCRPARTTSRAARRTSRSC